MKRLFNLIALAGVACLAVVSCKKEETPEPAKIEAPVLSVTPASVVVAPGSEAEALTFSWTDVALPESYGNVTLVQAFQVTKKGDNDFASGTAFECSLTQKKFSHAELEALANEIGASLDEGFSLIARVRVTAQGNKDFTPLVSNVVEVAVSKEQYAISNIYPIGNGTPYGWSQDKTVAMDKSGSTFTWTGHLYANAEFKFLLQNDGNWWPGIVNKTDDAYKYEPKIGFSDSEDKKFKVAKEGKYTITIDAANTNALKMTVEFIDDDIQALVVDHLYILGGATKTGWSLDLMEEFEKNGNIFTWEGPLTEDEFRFPMQRDWWPCLMIALDGETLVKGVSDDEKTGYKVAEAAIYKIVCDIDNMKVSISKTGEIVPPDFATVFMCGDATPYGWDNNMSDESQLKPEDSNKPNVLSWTGELKSTGTFKFLAKDHDWAPSYNRDATASEYWTLVYRATYDDPDEQFSVSEDGTYKVVIDIDALTISCTKQ